jgi:MerR family transcriptional regulator/heat shock protein HspR
MPRKILSREIVAENLAVPARLLLRYERVGLVEVVREGADEGYTPEQIRRVWTIVSLQRDLGVNLAGVQAILQLHSELEHVHHRLDDLADRLRAIVEAPTDAGHAP